jgi:hypothetical protein
MIRRPSRAFERASEEIADRTRAMARRPRAGGGLLLLVLGVAGFVWLFPEIRRYVRISRM